MKEYMDLIDEITLCGISGGISDTKYDLTWKENIYGPSVSEIEETVFHDLNMWWDPGLVVPLWVLPCGPPCALYPMALLWAGLAKLFEWNPYLEG